MYVFSSDYLMWQLIVKGKLYFSKTIRSVPNYIWSVVNRDMKRVEVHHEVSANVLMS